MPRRGTFDGGEFMCAASGGAVGAAGRHLLDEIYIGPRHDFVVCLVAITTSCLIVGAIMPRSIDMPKLRWFAIGLSSGLGALCVAVMVAATSTDVWLSVAYLVVVALLAVVALTAGQIIARFRSH